MKKVLICILLLFCASQTVFALSDDIEWKKVDENSFINPDGIIGVEDIYGYSFLLKSYNKGQYEPVMGRNIAYTIANYTIDCAKHTYKIGVIDSYDEDDSFVNGDYNKYATFQPVVQGTAVWNVASKLCRAL